VVPLSSYKRRAGTMPKVADARSGKKGGEKLLPADFMKLEAGR
jgi:hypothetical protein